MSTIQDVLIEHGIPFAGSDHKHGRSGWVQVDCPWCGPASGKYHLGISLSSGASSCWRCGNQNTAKVLAALTGGSAGALRKRIDVASMEAPIVVKTGSYRVPTGITPLRGAHIAYLTNRGFNAAEVAETWGIQGIANHGRLGWRLFIPIHFHGEPVSWTTRSIKPKETQRWISAGAEDESIRHKSILYGADKARGAIIIHEGPTDVWATGPGAVATCGTGFTESQLRAMINYPVRAVCFDSGEAAQRRANNLADMLSAFPGKTCNVLLETGDDPADADPAELIDLRNMFLTQ